MRMKLWKPGKSPLAFFKIMRRHIIATSLWDFRKQNRKKQRGIIYWERTGNAYGLNLNYDIIWAALAIFLVLRYDKLKYYFLSKFNI